MKITITATGGSPATLADHGKEGPDGFTFTPVRQIDVLQFVQGAYAKPKDRGNVLNQITFSRTVVHADHTTAQKYLITHAASVPATGQVDIELEDQVTHLVIHYATCEVNPLPLIGVRTTVAYTLKFGKVDEAVQVLTQSGGQILTESGNPIFVNREVL